MEKFTFIFGGVRSGKSSHAVKLAKDSKRKVVFVATAGADDDEMEKRIKTHKKFRPSSWKLIEEGIEIDKVLNKLSLKDGLVIIDCLGLFVTNMLMNQMSDSVIKKKINGICSAIKGSGLNVIVVSNDVGSGLVPDNLLARRFRDLLGLANQIMAQKADEVIFMQVGIPIKLK